ncbi:hypothetical protein AWENTII_010881 [Aspergillus wentii]
MTPDGVLKFFAERFAENDFTDAEKHQLRRTFDLLSQDGMLHDLRFEAHLQKKVLLPSSLEDAGPILYRSLLYLSQFPFDQKPVSSLTFDGLVRALSWADMEKSFKATGGGSFTRAKSPADCRRIIFQSLATTRDGKKLPFDVETARKESERRAFEFYPHQEEWLAGEVKTNNDEDGDEMFHDYLDILFEVQDTELGYAPLGRDEFRPLAQQFHGKDSYLHHLTIPQDQFRLFVQLLVLGCFGRSVTPIEEMPELDHVVDLILAPFLQNPNIGITWDVFDRASKDMPGLFDGLTRLLSRLFYTPPNDRGPLPKPGSIGTLPILSQIAFCGWDAEEALCFPPKSYNASSPITASALKDQITASPTPLVLLVSGKRVTTGENVIFGYCLPYSVPGEPHPSFLFQLGPTYDVFRARDIDRPRCLKEGDSLILGESGNGVAVKFNRDCSHVTVSHRVSGQNSPAYAATESRGDWEAAVDVDGIEIWSEVS